MELKSASLINSLGNQLFSLASSKEKVFFKKKQIRKCMNVLKVVLLIVLINLE